MPRVSEDFKSRFWHFYGNFSCIIISQLGINLGREGKNYFQRCKERNYKITNQSFDWLKQYPVDMNSPLTNCWSFHYIQMWFNFNQNKILLRFTHFTISVTHCATIFILCCKTGILFIKMFIMMTWYPTGKLWWNKSEQNKNKLLSIICERICRARKSAFVTFIFLMAMSGWYKRSSRCRYRIHFNLWWTTGNVT